MTYYSCSFLRCVGALRGRTTATEYNTPTAHFRNRRCLAKMPTTPGPRIRAQARGGSLLLTFPIGGRGSRHRRPLPDRPPTLQAFRSVLRETQSVSTRRLIKGSRSYLRRHGVQSRGATISYHKLTLSVYRKFCCGALELLLAVQTDGAKPHPNSFAIFAFFAAKEIEKSNHLLFMCGIRSARVFQAGPASAYR